MIHDGQDNVMFLGATISDRVKLPPSTILESANKEEFSEVIVVGIRQEVGSNGEKLCVARTDGTERAIWLLGAAQRYLSETLYDRDL